MKTIKSSRRIHVTYEQIRGIIKLFHASVLNKRKREKLDTSFNDYFKKDIYIERVYILYLCYTFKLLSKPV